MNWLWSIPPAAFPLAAAPVAYLASRRVGHAVGAVAGLLAFAWSLAAPVGVHFPTQLFGFDAALVAVAPISRTVGVALGFIAAANVVYAYATDANPTTTAYALAYTGVCLGAVFAGDWLTLVVFWELMAIGATLLLWNHDEESRRAGFRYAVYHEIGGAFLIAGVLLHYLRVGSFLFGAGGAGGVTGFSAGLPAMLAAIGIGLNVGFLGLHPWLVDSYPKPHVAATVVLCGCTTKVGVYALARAFPGGHVAIAATGGAMVLVGVTLAILQTEVRRLLTYHIVSQVGYMVAGVGVGTQLGRSGAMAHLLNNVLYKSLLFMVGGLLLVRTGTESLKKMGGLARRTPVLFATYLVAAFAIAGVPGFNGFVSKGMVIDSADTAEFRLLWWALVVGGVGTVISFSKFGYYAFLGERHGDSETASVRRLSPVEAAPLVAVAVACVLLGLSPDLLFSVLPAGTEEAKVYVTAQYVKAGAVLVAGGAAFALLKAPLSRVAAVPDLDSVYHPVGRRALDAAVAATTTAARGLDALATRPVLTIERWLDASPDANRLDSVGASVLWVVVALLVALAVVFVV
ncbi:proton-conducting transporter transmembrane domain-containing protein [Halorussus salinus]|uniref:proton-conducting transporter transmembrane domain-containing protein n=1 Tax=Halorussus salinus TaxID=1364935 RepID=UPI0010925419|nr:proton-conducting transporter membrane subunit [Halorussus salinus]